MFFGPHLLEADDGRCRQTRRVADEGRQHLLEVAGRDSLQVEDRDQHLKALRSPRISRQDRWRVSDALAIARCTVAHPRLANGDKADTGHDLALWKMAMAYHPLMARLGLEIRMLFEKLSNLRLDRLGQQRTRAAAQDLCQGVGEDPWLGELDDVTVGHGVSLLHWRSGGVEHHHDTPPYSVTPSPTSGHSSGRQRPGPSWYGPARLALSAVSEGQRPGTLVSGSHRRRPCRYAQDNDRCPGTQAAHWALAFCHRRRATGGCHLAPGGLKGPPAERNIFLPSALVAGF